MKSAEKITIETCRHLGLLVIEGESGTTYQIILTALQEYGQEREQATRHACAEAVQGIPDHRICKATMASACMNAKVE